MHTDDFRRRSGLQAVWIIVAQVLLRRERQLDYVVDRHYIFRRHIHLLHLVSIERHIMIYILYQLLKPLALQFPHLLTAHAFLVGIPDHDSIYFTGWSSRKAFMRSSRTGYNSSLMREVHALTPFCPLPVRASDMLLTP